MRKDKKKHGKRMTSMQEVELFFSRIIERQRLEEEYFNTGNVTLLSDIQKAREKIRECFNEYSDK